MEPDELDDVQMMDHPAKHGEKCDVLLENEALERTAGSKRS